MHFLCLHGRGTSSKIFEMQTGKKFQLVYLAALDLTPEAAVRYELGDHHTYDFVEGNIPWDMAPEIKNMMPGEHQMFAYFDHHSPETVLKAVNDFDNFIRDDGPYDGVITFSQAATVVGTWMIHQAKQSKLSESAFKCAVFLSAATPAVDYEALLSGQLVEVNNTEVAGIIDIPTAHVWGTEDQWADVASRFSEICKSDVRSIFMHSGGHEVPGTSSKEALNRSVNVIRRAIQLSVASG